MRVLRGLKQVCTKKREMTGVGGKGLPVKNEKDVERHGVGGCPRQRWSFFLADDEGSPLP
jgi:hypothetical protein